MSARLENSYLFREIHQQPSVLEQFLAQERDSISALAEEVHQRQVDYVVIAARGTSDNAGRYAQYLLGSMNGLLVALATPSLFSIYGRPPQFHNALVIGISQSGKSPDIVSVVAEAKRQGSLTAAITNEPDSDLAKQANHIITLHAGEERSVAATKTYTSQLCAIAALSTALADDPAMRESLDSIPEAAASTLKMNEAIAAVAPRYRYMQDCVVIGRGYNYATAFELSLKLKELTYTIAEPYSSADFMHGPLALIEQGFPAITVAPSGKVLPEMKEFVSVLNKREAETIVISDDADILGMSRIPLQLPAPVPEWLSPITSIIPGQLFAMHLAATRDYDPDHPRGLRKVTETK